MTKSFFKELSNSLRQNSAQKPVFVSKVLNEMSMPIKTYTNPSLEWETLESPRRLVKTYEFQDRAKMKEFVKDEGYSSMRGLAKDMRDAVINSDRSSLYLNTLLAALDFEKFVKLMIQKAARKREEAKLDEEDDNDGEESDNSNNSDTSTRHVNKKDINNYEGKHK